MKSLAQRFKAEAKDYRHLLKVAEGKVVRWEYWQGFHWHWDPAKVKSHEAGCPKKFASKRTTKDKATEGYGFDSRNQVVLIRSGLPWDNPPRWSEEIIRYSGNTLLCSRFFTGKLLEVATATMANGRVVRVEEIGAGSDWHTIEWLGKQVARIQFGRFGKKPGLEWCYDKSGKLVGMFDLPRKLKLPKGVTLESLKKTIYQRLMQLVPEVVGKAGIGQRAYCLAIAYDGEGNGVLPPILAIGLESERCNWMKSDPKNFKSLIWNPAEFRHLATRKLSLPADKRFKEDCGWLNQLLARKESDAPARKLLNEVARDLAKIRWDDKLPITDDFIVFAVDHEGVDLARNLKATVPAPILVRLKKAKML